MLSLLKRCFKSILRDPLSTKSIRAAYVCYYCSLCWLSFLFFWGAGASLWDLPTSRSSKAASTPFPLSGLEVGRGVESYKWFLRGSEEVLKICLRDSFLRDSEESLKRLLRVS